VESWACYTCVEDHSAYRVLVRKLEGMISFERPMHRWKDNIKMGL
jgi:hypothetical protein